MYDNWCRAKLQLHHPYNNDFQNLRFVDDEDIGWSGAYAKCLEEGHTHDDDPLADENDMEDDDEDDEFEGPEEVEPFSAFSTLIHYKSSNNGETAELVFAQILRIFSLLFYPVVPEMDKNSWSCSSFRQAHFLKKIKNFTAHRLTHYRMKQASSHHVSTAKGP
jgi:hypothetical protein